MNYGGGYKIFSPSILKSADFDFVIISVSEYQREITANLLEMGVDKEKIITFMHEDVIKWDEERYAMAKNCISYIKERKIKGNIAELGVYQGEFSSFLSKQLPDKRIYLFDTFEGFSQTDLMTKEVNGDESVFKDTSVDLVLKKMPIRENVIIKKGWFPDTADGLEDSFCFVSLDADLYNPIYAGLEFFYPRLEKGGYIFIHDFDSMTYPGCKQAVYDYCDKHTVSFVPILDRCCTAIITK